MMFRDARFLELVAICPSVAEKNGPECSLKEHLGEIARAGYLWHMHHRLPKGTRFRKLRELVLTRDRRTCQMCGARDKGGRPHDAKRVRLTVGLLVPRENGGSYSRNNSRTLCRECAGGLDKIPFTLLKPNPLVQSATRHESVHMRIGELLKAAGVGKAVPIRMIDIVANQPEWRRRLRELRCLGWRIAAIRTGLPGGRFQSAYRLDKFTEWPPDPSASIRRYAQRCKKRNKRSH
ncbi:MAG: hypothetical protein WB347_04170 [Terriglobales bacterium]